MPKRSLSYYLSPVPVTLSFLITVLAYALLWWQFKPIDIAKDDATAQLIFLLLKLLLITIAACISLSFITWFGSIIFNSWAKKTNRVQLQLKQLANAPTPTLHIQIRYWLSPLLGSSTIVWKLSNGTQTPAVPAYRIWKGFRPGRYTAHVAWPLEDYQAYTVLQMKVCITDIFHFFRWRISLPIQQSLHHLPVAPPSSHHNFTPYETTEEPITTKKRLPRLGELFQYKNFEDNDDVRRIVWKIYAKHKDLVVRTADVQYLPATQVYLYTSFYQPIKIVNDTLAQQTLNTYKERLWALVQAVEKEAIEIIWRTDQPTQMPTNDTTHSIQWQLTQCTWQQQHSIDQLIVAKHKGILCVTVYTPLTLLQKVLMEKKVSTIIFIPIIPRYKPFSFKTIFKWLWVSDGPGSSLWKSWSVWQQQNKLFKLEQQYIQQLQQNNSSVIILDEGMSV